MPNTLFPLIVPPYLGLQINSGHPTRNSLLHYGGVLYPSCLPLLIGPSLVIQVLLDFSFTFFFLFLKCLIQLDQRIQYQNAIARNLAHFLNSPQQGEPPSA